MTKNTYIKDLQEGITGTRQKDGQDVPWQKFTIIDADNWYYADFDHIKWLGPAFDNQTEVELTYTETPSTRVNPKTEKPYMNRTITSVKVAQSLPAEFEKRLTRIE